MYKNLIASYVCKLWMPSYIKIIDEHISNGLSPDYEMARRDLYIIDVLKLISFYAELKRKKIVAAAKKLNAAKPPPVQDPEVEGQIHTQLDHNNIEGLLPLNNSGFVSDFANDLAAITGLPLSHSAAVIPSETPINGSLVNQSQAINRHIIVAPDDLNVNTLNEQPFAEAPGSNEHDSDDMLEIFRRDLEIAIYSKINQPFEKGSIGTCKLNTTALIFCLFYEYRPEIKTQSLFLFIPLFIYF